jgi:hypothetical protein
MWHKNACEIIGTVADEKFQRHAWFPRSIPRVSKSNSLAREGREYVELYVADTASEWTMGPTQVRHSFTSTSAT